VQSLQAQPEYRAARLSEIRRGWPEVAALAERVAKGQRLEGLDAGLAFRFSKRFT
jgi:hypothetical protein